MNLLAAIAAFALCAGTAHAAEVMDCCKDGKCCCMRKEGMQGGDHSQHKQGAQGAQGGHGAHGGHQPAPQPAPQGQPR
jgi:hypothetical protein